jgi:septum formation protein
MTHPPVRLVLASGSSIRHKILRDAGIEFEVLTGIGEEPSPTSGEDAETYVVRCAEEKARACWEAHATGLENATIIGCDQVVRFEGKILRKLDSLSAAVDRLMDLQGGPHELVNGFVALERGGVLVRRKSIVTLRMRRFERHEIEAYINDEKPLSSVACYYLEGKGMKLIRELHGDFHAALGLPLRYVVDLLCDKGARIF